VGSLYAVCAFVRPSMTDGRSLLDRACCGRGFSGSRLNAVPIGLSRIDLQIEGSGNKNIMVKRRGAMSEHELLELFRSSALCLRCRF